MNSRVHQGHFARKRFGQNFLNDSNIINNIISAIAPKDDDILVEIGPGLGALTEPMAEKIAHLTVIELDKDLAARLATHPFIASKLSIIQQDALTIDFKALSNDLGGKLRVFGNLPYNISTPIMFSLFEYTEAIQDMHFMLQKEVVNRLVAGPNSKTYGRLSVMAQFYCDIIPVMEVPPTAFRPAPKVDSAVVKLIPKMTRIPLKSIKALSQVTNMAFNQRRKTIKNSLESLFNEEQLRSLGLDLNLRAENLSLNDYCQLANLLTENNG